MSIYHVEKTELQVVIFQADGSVMKGVVFLSAAAYTHMGKQTLLDLMKEPGDFFPFRSEAGDFCVTNKRTITHIRFDPPKEVADFCPLGEKEDVDIKFVGGEQLSGTILIEMPEGKTRLFDFLTAMVGFFPLTTQEAHYLVNVDQIRDVSPRR